MSLCVGQTTCCLRLPSEYLLEYVHIVMFRFILFYLNRSLRVQCSPLQEVWCKTEAIQAIVINNSSIEYKDIVESVMSAECL